MLAHLAYLLHVLQGAVQQWLGKYQDTAVEYAQQGYDQIQEYVRSNFNDYVEANNLTQVERHCILSIQPEATHLTPPPQPPTAPLALPCWRPALYLPLQAQYLCSAFVAPAVKQHVQLH